jgi:hypothetical protein
MISLAQETPESKVLAKELGEKADETFLVFSKQLGAAFGECIYMKCSEPQDLFLEVKLNDEKETRPISEVVDLEKKINSIDILDEKIAQKKRIAVIMAWLNKGKKYKDFVKCPTCKKILILDFWNIGAN